MEITQKLKFPILSNTIIVLILLVGTGAVAQEKTQNFRSARDEAMGGAGVAIVDDETALFVNPAGLGKVRGTYLSLINPELETNYSTVSAIGANLSSYAGAQDPNALLNLAVKNPDKNLHAKFQVQPTLVMRNFAIGGLANYSLNAQYSSATGTMQYNYINDYAAAIGYCFRLWEGRLKIGIMGKVDNRVYISTTVAQSATGLSIPNLASEGTGVGWDGSIMLTAPWAMLPTITVVAHDVGNTNFTLGNGMIYTTTTRPPPQMQKVDAGMAIFPYDGQHTRASFTVQFSDLQNPYSQSIIRNIHAGAEVNFSDVFYMRAGYNEGYYTAGIEVDLGGQQVQITTYGEEIGVYPKFTEDRRFVARYGFRF